MKNILRKYTLLLIALFISTASFADSVQTCSVKKNGETIGYVTAYISGEKLYVSNDTDSRVTVTVAYEISGVTYTKVITVDAHSTSVPYTVKMSAEVVKVSNPICS